MGRGWRRCRIGKDKAEAVGPANRKSANRTNRAGRRLAACAAGTVPNPISFLNLWRLKAPSAGFRASSDIFGTYCRPFFFPVVSLLLEFFSILLLGTSVHSVAPSA